MHELSIDLVFWTGTAPWCIVSAFNMRLVLASLFVLCAGVLAAQNALSPYAEPKSPVPKDGSSRLDSGKRKKGTKDKPQQADTADSLKSRPDPQPQEHVRNG
jgi:hypothetical protein